MMMGTGTAALLVSAAAGYWVLERAQTHTKGALKRVGQFVGWAIILSSFFCLVWCAQCAAQWRGGYGGKSMWCPFGKMAPPAAPVQP